MVPIKILRVAATLFVSVSLLGCGGMDQDDLRKFSIKRPKDEDDVKRPVVGTPPRGTAAPTPPTTTTPQSTGAPARPPATPNSTPTTSEPPIAAAVSPVPSVPPIAAPPISQSDTVPPGTVLSPTERRQRTINNLERIGKAFEAYLAQRNAYPSHAIYDKPDQPLLSWRVELLPYLGYQNLYDQFNRAESWDSLTNKALLARIPAVYQSPERFDDRTNYLVPYGTATPFFGQHGKPPRRWEDGRTNVALLLEVDDTLAQPWTKPADYVINSQSPMAGLGGLREDGLFMVWCGGQLARIAKNTSLAEIRAMYSIDGGESLSAGSISLAIESAPSAPTTHIAINVGAFNGPTSRPSAATASSTSVAAVSPSDDLVYRARQAFEYGMETEAVRLVYVALLTERIDVANAFRWISGLKRPAAFVRYGIAVDYTGTNKSRYDSLYVNETQGWSGRKSAFTQGTGKLGERMLEYLENTKPVFLSEIGFGASATTTNSQAQQKTDRIAPCKSFMGLGEQAEMLRLAERKEIDILLMFNIEDRTALRSSVVNHLVSLEVLDVVSRRSLYKSKQISYRKRERDLRDPLFEDPIEVTLREFSELVEQKLNATEIPAKIDADLIAKRAEWLSRKGSVAPLRALAELYFYRRRGLLTLDQTLTSYQTILGTENGLKLLAGNVPDRDQVLAAFIPRFELPDTQKSARD